MTEKRYVIGVEAGGLVLSHTDYETGERVKLRYESPIQFRQTIRRVSEKLSRVGVEMVILTSSSIDFPEEDGMTAERLAEFIG